MISASESQELTTPRDVLRLLPPFCFSSTGKVVVKSLGKEGMADFPTVIYEALVVSHDPACGFGHRRYLEQLNTFSVTSMNHTDN